MYTSRYPQGASPDRTPETLKRGAHGLEPFGTIAARVMSDLAFRRHAVKVHRLGERATAECFAELAARWGSPDEVDQVLCRFAGIDPRSLRRAGGTRLSPAPVHEVASNTIMTPSMPPDEAASP